MNSVEHPAHYNVGGIEVIDAIDAWKLNFSRGNAVKYIARAGHKDRDLEIEDLQKAEWYIHHEIEQLKAQHIKSCKGCVAHIGGGQCRDNLEAECAAGGGYEAYRAKGENHE